jgi:hypothetical protein
MRLSETSLRPKQAPSPAQQRVAEQEHKRQRKARIRKTGLSFGLLAMLAAALVGGIAYGRHLTTHAAADNPNCTLIIPPQPLTAKGLATPYQLTATNAADGPCNEANPAQTAFVQGAVFDPATSQISIYNPLVIDKGTQPAAAPVMPQLPANAVVALWFGFNGTTLHLEGGARAAGCINGLGTDLFGQFAYCNAPQFFRAANQAIQAGTLQVPALGTANDGMTCPTVRDFSVVDQDQSDNVTTTYLVTQGGQIAQNTAANAAALAGTHVQVNASDNRLLDVALDGALGCTPWMAPDLADNGKLVPALPLNELQAAMFQQAPVALVPTGDPMVLVNGKSNLTKTNLYRMGVDQTPAASPRMANTATYCQNMLKLAPPRIKLDMPLTINRAPPDAGVGNSLFTFLAARFNLAFGPNGLNCPALIKQQSPITVQTNGNGVAINATINLNANQGGMGGNGGNGGNNGGNGGMGGNGGNNGDNNGGMGGNGGNTGANNTGNGGQANAPTCVINGTPVQGCMGTTTLNGQTCTVAFDANTKQVTINCQ